jgi:hypothetical protein
MSTDFSRTKTIDGVEHVARVCDRCGGTGYISTYTHVYGGVCFSCNGVRSTQWEPKADAEKRAARNAAARERREAKRVAERKAAFDSWVVANPETVRALTGYEGRNEFVAEMAETVRAGRTLTDRQAESVTTALAREEAEAAASEEVPAGRQLVTGTVVSTKVVDSQYGSTLKMLVDCGAFRVFGTVPGSIDPHRGDTVSFTATLSPAEEKGFGFYSRPTKAQVWATE